MSKVLILKTDIKGLENTIGDLRFASSHEFGTGKTIMTLQMTIASVAQFGFKIIYVNTEKAIDQYLSS